MSRFAAVLFALVAMAYLGLLVAGLIALMPWGLAGLALLLLFLFLFLWVWKDRLENKEDDHYDRNIDL